MSTGRHNRGAAVAILAFAYFIDLIDVTIVNVALASIRADLGASPEQLEWVVGGYSLTFAAGLVLGARLGDRWGRRTVFVLGLAGFTLASLLAAMAPDGTVLVFARVLQGAFSALTVPQLLSSVQALYEPRERGPIFAMTGVLSGLAAVAGPVLGGWLIDNNAFGVGWRSVFAINVPIGLVIALAAWWLVPNTRAEHRRRFDLLGCGLLLVGVGGLVFGLIEGRALGWPWWLWLVMVAAVALIALFVGLQRRHELAGREPLLPIGLFTNRGYAAGLATQFAFSAAMIGLFLVLTIYLQAGVGLSPWQAGLTLLPFPLASLLGSAVAVPLGIRVGRLLTVAGAVMMAAGTLWLRGVVEATGPNLVGTDLIWPLALAGLGLGLLVVPLIDIALATVPPAQAGAASGAYSTLQQTGAAFGVAVVGLVFFDAAGWFRQAQLQFALGRASLVVAIGFAACAALALLLPPTAAVRDRHQPEQHPSTVDA